MSNGKGYALVIISLVIGAIGVGMGTYSALNFAVIEGPQGDSGEEGVDGINGTLNNVVGIWETVEGGPATIYSVNVSDAVLLESEFCTVEDNNIFNLHAAGWYHFNIKFLWEDLASTTSYYIIVFKSDVSSEIIARKDLPTYTTHFVDVDAYVYSNGSDYFEFTCAYFGTPDNSEIAADQRYNQIVLEYIKEA